MLQFDWHLLLLVLEKIALSFVLVLPIGWIGEKERHTAGIRTFPIVAMASCGYLLLISQTDVAATSRVMQGLIAGIGFVGGGAIMKEGATVRGIATAASIWNTGAIGAAVALGRAEVAIALATFNLLTLQLLVPLKKKLDDQSENTEPKL